jgi:hypothetical protein
MLRRKLAAVCMLAQGARIVVASAHQQEHAGHFCFPSPESKGLLEKQQKLQELLQNRRNGKRRLSDTGCGIPGSEASISLGLHSSLPAMKPLAR